MKNSNVTNNRLLIHLNEVADTYNQDYRRLNRGSTPCPASFLSELDEILAVEVAFPYSIKFCCDNFEFRMSNCLNFVSFDFGGGQNHRQAVARLTAASLDALRRVGQECLWGASLRTMAVWFREFGVSYSEVTLQFSNETVRIQQNVGKIQVSLRQKSNGSPKPNGSRFRPASQIIGVI